MRGKVSMLGCKCAPLLAFLDTEGQVKGQVIVVALAKTVEEFGAAKGSRQPHEPLQSGGR